MAIERVKIEKIRDQEPALAQGVNRLEHALRDRLVAMCLKATTGARMGKDIGYLADRDDARLRWNRGIAEGAGSAPDSVDGTVRNRDRASADCAAGAV